MRLPKLVQKQNLHSFVSCYTLAVCLITKNEGFVHIDLLSPLFLDSCHENKLLCSIDNLSGGNLLHNSATSNYCATYSIWYRLKKKEYKADHII